jgi:hypothetical protein
MGTGVHVMSSSNTVAGEFFTLDGQSRLSFFHRPCGMFLVILVTSAGQDVVFLLSRLVLDHQVFQLPA